MAATYLKDEMQLKEKNAYLLLTNISYSLARENWKSR